MAQYRGYNAVIPPYVRYCDALTPGAKLMYGELSALCVSEGYCTATNKYLAGLYSVNERTIQRYLELLDQLGFIKIVIEAGSRRKIYLPEARYTFKEGDTIVTPIKPEKEIKPNENIEKIFNTWKEVLNHPRAVLDANRKKKLTSLLKQNFSVDQLLLVPLGVKNSPWHMGNNPSGTKYHEFNTIYRDADQIERFISLASTSQVAKTKISECRFCEWYCKDPTLMPCQTHHPEAHAEYLKRRNNA